MNELMLVIFLCQTSLRVVKSASIIQKSIMNYPNETRESWHPQNKHDCEAILRELHEILASPHFCNSKRYPALLRYVVENTLAGKSELLKERTIGVEVFDRPPTYDTGTDTVVRYTAGEVRKRLLLYYSEHGRNSSIHISLPAGSYIPEFLYGHIEPEETGESTSNGTTLISGVGGLADLAEDAPNAVSASQSAHAGHTSHSIVETGEDASLPFGRRKAVIRLMLWLTLAAIVALGLFVGLRWIIGPVQPQTALNEFWAPVLSDQRTVSICTGASVFSQSNFSGVATAGKDIDYPFVSMQIASSIVQLTGLLERSGATLRLESSATTPLTDLREHSVVLLGGYNNQWTMRLSEPLRFHLVPGADEVIVDRMQPQAHWSRDSSLPYSSADDYALLARFRDATTDSWVVVLAGLGRNGTEAAAQFATSPHYMQLLRNQMGKNFSNHNVEVVLKVNVVDGKTGAPSILAVHVW